MNGKRAKLLRKDAKLLTDDTSGLDAKREDILSPSAYIGEEQVGLKVIGHRTIGTVSYPKDSQRSVYKLIKKIHTRSSNAK